MIVKPQLSDSLQSEEIYQIFNKSFVTFKKKAIIPKIAHS